MNENTKNYEMALLEIAVLCGGIALHGIYGAHAAVLLDPSTLHVEVVTRRL